MAYRSQKPQRPFLNRAHPLCRGLLFASAVGWERGFTEGELGVSLEDTGLVGCAGRRHRGVISSVAGTGWANYGYGVTLDEGPVAKSAAWELTPGSGDNWPGGVTIFAALRKEGAAIVGADAFVVGRRSTTVAGANGFNLGTQNTALATGWSFEICNGLSQANVNSGTGTQIPLQDTTLCGTYDNANLRFYQDGILVGTTASVIGIGGTPTVDYRAFNNTTNTLAQIDSALAAWFVWDRPLPQSAIAQLHSDPYTMYRHRPSRFFSFMAGARRVDNGCCC